MSDPQDTPESRTRAARRIAFVAPRFAEGATLGGAETLLRQLAERAAGAGRDVTFLTTCAQNHFTWNNVVPPGSRRVGSLNVMFFPVDAGRDLDTFLSIQNRICQGSHVPPEDELAWLRNSVNSTALCDFLRQSGRDFDRIVMGPYLFGLTYFASQVIPERTLLVPCLHDEPFARVQALAGMFHTVGGLMFNSDPERDLAMRLYGLAPDRCRVVGMGLSDFAADPQRFREAHGLTAPYVIYSGRREPLKGTPLLLDYLTAFRERTRRDVKLVLTGSGLVECPPALAGHVLDLGFVTEADKHDAMAGATAFCHPSVNESFSIVIMESWLAGTPVLVHAGSAVMQAHCRRSNGGLWFTTYPEFEEALTLLLDRQDLRRHMGQAGRAYVLDQYSWNRIDQVLFAALDGTPLPAR